jgi:cAMP-dependent protein kinase regulator
VPKSAEACKRLEDSLRSNIMFAHLDADERQQVFDAMFQVDFDAGAVIIKQGDDGDNFYVIDSGTCDIYVQKPGDDEPKLVLTLNAGGSFGELALIYGSPRAATVKAKSNVSLWAIDRITYRRIMMGTTMRKRKLYETFLEKVPILQHLTKYERITVADALESYTYTAGEMIVRQGEPGDKFYIIVTGEVRCEQTTTAEGGAKTTAEVGRLGPSAYFGEIALLTNRPRAATVTSQSATSSASASTAIASTACSVRARTSSGATSTRTTSLLDTPKID